MSGTMQDTVAGPVTGLPRHPKPPWRLAAAAALLAATVIIVITGLRIAAPGGLPAVQAAAFAVTLAWAVAAADRQPGPGPGRAVARGGRGTSRGGSPHRGPAGQHGAARPA